MSMRSSASASSYSSSSLLGVVVVAWCFLQTAHAFVLHAPRTFGIRQQQQQQQRLGRISAVSQYSSAENQVGANNNGDDADDAPRSSPRSIPKSSNHADIISTSPLVSLIPSFPQNYTLVSPAADILELQPDQRLVCIGDVHGDLRALEDFLTLAGVYSNNGDGSIQWTGGNTIVVQCGDILDRGSQELACFSLLTRLSQLAGNDGGQVICLFGNHEALNSLGLFHHATSDSEYERLLAPWVDQSLLDDNNNNDNDNNQDWRIQYAGNQPARWAAYEPGGLLAYSLLANMKVAVQVGRTVCVHAGLTVDHLNDYGGISGMNQQAQAWVRQVQVQTGDANGSGNALWSNLSPNNITTNININNQGKYTNMQQAMAEAEARQQYYIDTCPAFLGGGIGASSPVWMRDYSAPNDMPPKNPDAQKMIDAALATLDADRMVMGHTVQREINGALNGKAWRVDVGASRGMVAGTPEVLQVQMVNGTEVVSILTKNGKGGGGVAVVAVPASERHVTAFVNML